MFQKNETDENDKRKDFESSRKERQSNNENGKENDEKNREQAGSRKTKYKALFVFFFPVINFRRETMEANVDKGDVCRRELHSKATQIRAIY